MPESPLVTYLRIQRAADADVIRALRASATSIDIELARLERKTGVGGEMRRQQLRQSQVAIQRQLASYWTKVGDLTEARRAESAAAGAESVLRQHKDALLSVLPRQDYDYLARAAQQTALQGLEAVEQRLAGTSYVPLAQSVYDNAALSSGKIDEIVNSALARGASASELARDVRAYVNPNTPGGVRYASQRLARSELNNAFHAASVKRAQEEPWVDAVLWNLSGSHPVPDECNDYADGVHFKGGEPGQWKPSEVPGKPHPNCLCFTTAETMSQEAFVDAFFRGDFDTYLGDQGLEDFQPAPDFPAMSSNPRQDYRNFLKVRKGGVHNFVPGTGLEQYVGYGFKDVNTFLRTGVAESASKVARIVSSLDNKFKREALNTPRPMTVQRGLRSLDASVYREGEYVVEAAYTSTTMNPTIANQFANGTLYGADQGDGWIVEILLPRDTRFLAPGNGAGEESEILLPRNSKFAVRKVDQKNRRVWMELVK